MFERLCRFAPSAKRLFFRRLSKLLVLGAGYTYSPRAYETVLLGDHRGRCRCGVGLQKAGIRASGGSSVHECSRSAIIAAKHQLKTQAGRKRVRLFCLCARQGALTSWLKSNAGPARGTASRTARVSIARWNLKEADGKTLVLRTETAYEAALTDKRAKRLKVRCLHGSQGRRCGRHKRGGQCALPGEVSGGAIKLARSRGRDEATGEVSRGHSSRNDWMKGRSD